MSVVAIAAIAVVALLLAGAIVVFTTTKRAETKRATGHLAREARKKDVGAVVPSEVAAQTGREVELAAASARDGLAVRQPPALEPWVPRDPEQVQMDRRHFMNLGMIIMSLFALSGLGAAIIAFLWPKSGGGFGSKVAIGSTEDVENGVKAGSGFFYVPEARSYVTKFPAEGLEKAAAAYPESVYAGMEEGYVAIYQRCVHLGCRVPQCLTSQWFECPCHGSQYNRVGEKKGGPAPRGLDHFALSVENGKVFVNTATVITGVPIGTNTTGQEAEGPNCVGAGGGH
jgi:cytochrome b6-f complex iron-sulfur subunit